MKVLKTAQTWQELLFFSLRKPLSEGKYRFKTECFVLDKNIPSVQA